jgi:hypothetical protein
MVQAVTEFAVASQSGPLGASAPSLLHCAPPSGSARTAFSRDAFGEAIGLLRSAASSERSILSARRVLRAFRGRRSRASGAFRISSLMPSTFFRIDPLYSGPSQKLSNKLLDDCPGREGKTRGSARDDRDLSSPAPAPVRWILHTDLSRDREPRGHRRSSAHRVSRSDAALRREQRWQEQQSSGTSLSARAHRARPDSVVRLLWRDSAAPVRRPSPKVSDCEDQDFLFELEVNDRVRKLRDETPAHRNSLRDAANIR